MTERNRRERILGVIGEYGIWNSSITNEKTIHGPTHIYLRTSTTEDVRDRVALRNDCADVVENINYYYYHHHHLSHTTTRSPPTTINNNERIHPSLFIAIVTRIALLLAFEFRAQKKMATESRMETKEREREREGEGEGGRGRGRGRGKECGIVERKRESERKGGEGGEGREGGGRRKWKGSNSRIMYRRGRRVTRQIWSGYVRRKEVVR